MITLNITKNTLLMVWWVVRLCQKSFSRNTQLQMFNSWSQIILIQPGKSIWAARARETKKNTSVHQLWPAYNQISKRETRWKYNLVGKIQTKNSLLPLQMFLSKCVHTLSSTFGFLSWSSILPNQKQRNVVRQCATRLWCLSSKISWPPPQWKHLIER